MSRVDGSILWRAPMIQAPTGIISAAAGEVPGWT